MNRLFTKQEVVSGYNLPPHLQDELLRGVEPVERDRPGEPLYLESQVDRWLSGRYERREDAVKGDAAQAPMLTIREVAVLLRCSYSEAREKMLDGRIRAIRDGRWLRTRREWVEEYVAGKTIKPVGDEPGVYTVPKEQQPTGKVRVYPESPIVPDLLICEGDPRTHRPGRPLPCASATPRT